MELTHTISLIEIVWTLGCSPGLYYGIKIFRRATGDLFTLRRKKINSIREFSAMTTLILFGYLALMQFMFVLVGFLTMLAPQSNTNGAASTKFMVTGIFLLLSFLSSAIDYVVDKRRRSLRDMITALETEDDIDKLKEAIHGPGRC